MVIYIETDGNVKILSPENLYQGSTSNRITLLTPFPSTTAVGVGFILPDGTTVTDESKANFFPMSLISTETASGITSTAYDYALPFTVLEQYGDLKIAFKATFSNGNQTSYLATVEVQESILPKLPTEPTPDVYQLLLEYIQKASADAESAVETAEAAQTAAENATNTANTAESNSETAISTANAAKSAADTAESNSEQAVTTANNAAATASAAVQTAGAANATANAANTTANQAKDEAESANTYAQGAVSAANTANTIAAEARETANEAEDIARGIDGKATEALSNSQTAVSTANEASATATEAKTTADGIDGKATEALSNSEQAIETADEAKALAEQAVAGAGTEVYVNNALQPKLNFTSDPQTQINGINTDINGIKTEISEINTDISEINTDIDGINTDINGINTQLSEDVIRTDEAQDLTETQKKTFAANMGKPYGNKYSGGWMKMAVLKRTSGGASALYAVFLISSSNNPMAYGLLKVSTYTTPSAFYERSIELISLSSSGLNPSLIRGVYDNSDNSITIYVKGSAAYNAITLQTISNCGLEPFDITIDPEDVTTEPTANITCTWGRIEASSFVQDGHNVALQDGTYSDMTVGEAVKLKTARAVQVNLASGSAQNFDGSADISDVGVKGILPVANGGTGATNLSNVTVGRATADGNGNNIPNTYATKALGTYTAAGLAKVASTTNGGVITSGNSDDTVPTVKNICDWARNNFLTSGEPDWVTGTSGSLNLDGDGWYIFRATTNTAEFHYSGIVYAYTSSLSYGYYPTLGSNITAAGFTTTANKLTYAYGDGAASTSVAYYKLA